MKLNGTHQLLVYADDVNILGRSVHTVRKTSEALIVASKQTGKTGKAGPLQASSGPECSRKLRFPDFMTKAQNGCKFVSLTLLPTLSPRSTPGTHFC